MILLFQANADRVLFKEIAACSHSDMVAELTGGAQDVEAVWEEPGAQQFQATAKDSPGGTAGEKNVRKFFLRILVRKSNVKWNKETESYV